LDARVTTVALLVAPLLVIVSFLIGTPMNLVFENPLEVMAIAGVNLRGQCDRCSR